ncbi:MAG: hypothetical protein PHI85_10650 [Victivallaceae bacterium]|nr:hypothetical protein [Victivallaceae bacterium]
MNVSPEKLISLLEDADDNSAVSLFSALLAMPESVLLPLVAAAQDSPDAALRKRIHQLGAILILRDRRRGFAAKMNAPDTDIIDGLIDLHLQWFDSDSRRVIDDQYRLFIADSGKFDLSRPQGVVDFMRFRGFAATALEDIAFPEHFCLGAVLESGRGCDALLCALAKTAAAAQQLKLSTVRNMGTFSLRSADNTIITPAGGWKIETSGGEKAPEYSDAQLLRYAAQSVFAYAVEADSFRYIYTLAAAVSGKDSVDFLPYPFAGN